MLFRRKKRYGARCRSDFHLQEEGSHLKASGSGFDEFVRVKDDTGNVWTGIIEQTEQDVARYYLSDLNGRRITGLVSNKSMVFRDDQGRTWRGFME
jgi:hypothetical protein